MDLLKPKQLQQIWLHDYDDDIILTLINSLELLDFFSHARWLCEFIYTIFL